MSRHLINEHPLIVLPTLAEKIGLNEAIVLQQVQYWLSNPKAGIMHDGHKWVHNTYAEWAENFPFWSESGVKKIILRLEHMGLLVSAQTSPNPYDHTKSYRINYDNLDERIAHVELEESALRQHSQSPDDETSEVRSPQILLSDTTNNTANEEKPPSLPMDWKIATGQPITEQDLALEVEKKRIDTANLIAMGMGGKRTATFGIAYEFMKTRGILIPEKKIKAQRKAVTEMVDMGVLPHHVKEATEKLLAAGMTVTDLYSVAKTAIAIANPAPEQTEHGFVEGV